MTTLRSNVTPIGIKASGGGGGGSLQTQAAALKSGEWMKLGSAGSLGTASSMSAPTGLSLFVSSGGLFSGGASGISTFYMDKFARDAANKRFYFCGSDHASYSIFLRYDESTNAWTSLATPGTLPFGATPGNGNGTAHGYDANCWAPVNNTFWFRSVGWGLHRYWNGTSWNTLTGAFAYPNSTGAIEWFPEFSGGRLIDWQVENGLNGKMVAINPSTLAITTIVSEATTTLNPSPDYNHFTLYSAVRQICFVGGGTRKTLWTLNASGTITRIDDTPASIANVGANSVPDSQPFINPSNGNLVAIYQSNNWWECNPSAASGSQWTQKTGSVAMLQSNSFDSSSPAVGVISGKTEYGVVAFIKGYSQAAAAEMWIWKP